MNIGNQLIKVLQGIKSVNTLKVNSDPETSGLKVKSSGPL